MTCPGKLNVFASRPKLLERKLREAKVLLVGSVPLSGFEDSEGYCRIGQPWPSIGKYAISTGLLGFKRLIMWS